MYEGFDLDLAISYKSELRPAVQLHNHLGDPSIQNFSASQ